MKTIRICTSCRAPLPGDAPAGLCPACLLKSEVPTPAVPDAESTLDTGSPPSPVPGQDFGGYRILRLLGVAAVNRDGRKASRLRLLGRTLLAWSLCFAGAALSMALWMMWLPGFQSGTPVLAWALSLLTLLMLGGVAWAVWKPARSLPDLATGLWLVPR